MKINILKNRLMKFKVLILPLVALFLTTAIITGTSIITAKGRLMKQMEDSGTKLAKEISFQVEGNTSSMESIDEAIEERIRTLGNFLCSNVNLVNNEYLTGIAKLFNVDEVNVTDNKGVVVYSNVSTSLGAVFGSDHISYSVLSGKQNELMENIRKSRETNNYYKYGYVRKSDGGMIQIGILANKVQKLNESLSYQNLVEGLIKDKEIVEACVFDKNFKTAAHSDKKKVGTQLDNEEIKKAISGGNIFTKTIHNEDKGVKVLEVCAPVYKNGAIESTIDIELSLDSINKTINSMIFNSVLIAFILFALSAMVLYSIAKNITGPLSKLVNASKSIADGQLDIDFNLEINDEIGFLGENFKKMVESLKSVINGLKNNTKNVDEMATSLNKSAEEVTCAANEMTVTIQEVAKGANQQAQDLIDIANIMEDLSNSIETIYGKLTLVKESSMDAESKAKEGHGEIDILLNSINEIKSAFAVVSTKIGNLAGTVSKIDSISDVINSISEQTNLLALNAAIEAARAGEVGRGFAVVAEEIRKLAEESRKSTDEIKGLVQSISQETDDVMETSDGVDELLANQLKSAESTVDTFKLILEAVSKVAPLIEDTNTSMDNTMQSKNIAVEKVEAISSVAQEVSASSEEISASSEEMLSRAQELSNMSVGLNDLSKQLTEQTNKFKI